MQLEFRNNRDFWAGVMLIVVGAGSVIIARNYAFGTSLRMGPGYFPSVLGGGLVLFGLYLVVTGLRHHEKLEGSNWSLRALIVLPLALVLFGLLMEHAGFIPALLVLIFGSAAAGTEFKLVEVLLLSVGLTAFSVALFIYGLGLPYPLLAGW
jgi:Tripartite tricarboxylate transporter TctB family